MKLLLFCLISFAAALAHGQSTVTDSFSGTSLSTNWTVLSGSFTISGGQVWGTGASDLAYYSGVTFTSDQYSCFTLVAQNPKSGTQIGPVVRVNSAGTSWFWVKINGGTATITETNNGLWMGALTGDVSVTAAHEYCLFAVGSTVSLTDSGTPGSAGATVLTLLNTTLTGGSPGMQQVAAGGPGNNLASFRAGSLGVAATPPVTPPTATPATTCAANPSATGCKAMTSFPAACVVYSDNSSLCTATAATTVVTK